MDFVETTLCFHGSDIFSFTLEAPPRFIVINKISVWTDLHL